MVKKLIAGILGRKEEDQKPQESQGGSDVPDELPPLAEDLATKAEEKAQPQPAAQAVAQSVQAAPASLASSAPDELPPLDETPTVTSSQESGTLADLEPGSPIPDAIKKAKLAKLKVETPSALTQSSVGTSLLSSPPRMELPKPSDGFSVRERIKSGSEIGFFSTVLDHVKRNEGAKDKLLAGDLFVRMDNYWDMRKHEIKTGQMAPAEKKLDDDLMLKLDELRILEQKWQVQKLGLEEDLRYLHEREREIQSKIKELKLISNELNLYKNVKPEEYFYMKNAVVLKNLHDLIDILEIMDSDSFNFHVRPGRNDFSDWVRHVYSDNHLADKLKVSRTRMEMIEALETIPVGLGIDQEKMTFSASNPKKYFWLSNGVVIRTLFELSDALKTMDDALFEKHVNASTNDFAKWVTETLKNDSLGQKLAKTRSRKEMITLIEAYL